MKSVLIRPPPIANSIRPRCVNPRLPPSPTTRVRTWLPLMRTLSFVRSPTSALVSFECFTYVPMPPFHRRSTGDFRIARITSFGGISCRRVVGDAERRARLRRQRDALRPPVVHAAARRQGRRVVVGPRRAREEEEPAPLLEADRGIGVRVDEDVPVVEGADEPERRRQQHPVAEHVAGHVADPHHPEGLRLRVDAHLSEVALHRLPRAACGDGQLLVVVAGRAAGGERVAQPEPVLGGDGVRGVARTSPCPCRRRRPGRDPPRRSTRTPAGARSARPRGCR